MIGRQKWRLLFVWLSRAFLGVFLYRLERSLYLVFGDYYKFIRILLLPFILPITAYSNIDIHYKANVGGGLLILHPALGIVISGKSKIGNNLTLVGGNCIGINKWSNDSIFTVGDNCTLGANASIIGPLQLGNTITIGAAACVVTSFQNNGVTLVGVPAKSIN